MKSQLRKHLWFSRMVFALSLGLLFLSTGCANSPMSATPSALSPSAPSAPSSVSVVMGPTSLAVDPTGKFAYVANEGCLDDCVGSVSMYTINPTDGTLTSAGSPVTSGDFGADSVAVDPSGKF